MNLGMNFRTKAYKKQITNEKLFSVLEAILTQLSTAAGDVVGAAAEELTN